MQGQARHHSCAKCLAGQQGGANRQVFPARGLQVGLACSHASGTHWYRHPGGAAVCSGGRPAARLGIPNNANAPPLWQLPRLPWLLLLVLGGEPGLRLRLQLLLLLLETLGRQRGVQVGIFVKAIVAYCRPLLVVLELQPQKCARKSCVGWVCVEGDVVCGRRGHDWPGTGCTALCTTPHRTALHRAASTHLHMLQHLAGQRRLEANLALGRQGRSQRRLLLLLLLLRGLLLPLLLLVLLLLPALLLLSLVSWRRLAALQVGHGVLGNHSSQELHQLLRGLDDPAEKGQQHRGKDWLQTGVRLRGTPNRHSAASSQKEASSQQPAAGHPANHPAGCLAAPHLSCCNSSSSCW